MSKTKRPGKKPLSLLEQGVVAIVMPILFGAFLVCMAKERLLS